MTSANLPHSIQIAIVGLGPRGLSVLERLLARLRTGKCAPVDIIAIDPGQPGCGAHPCDMPEQLMLNTMAGQMSIFPQGRAADADPSKGPNFLEWCQLRSIRIDARGHVSREATGQPVSYGDFVPRRLLGQYLLDCYQHMVQHRPPQVSVTHLPQTVVKCQASPAGTGHDLTLASGETLRVDAVFLATGHPPPHNVPFTPPSAIDAIPAGGRVAVAGLGLTAMDVIASLTEGRGGRFVPTATGVRYSPSGEEPQIFMYSATGQPYHSRPRWTESGRLRAKTPMFLTRAAIDTLRITANGGQLDFEQHLLPLLRDEMRSAYYLTASHLRSVHAGLESETRLKQAKTGEERTAAFAALASEFGPFSPDDLLTTENWRGCADTYQGWYQAWITEDLAQSRLGTSGSPLKAALEVWRDSRPVLRYAIDHGGLTETSATDFYRRYVPLANRLVGGPQKERYEDLLALIEAGIVRVLPPLRTVAHLPEQEGILLKSLDEAAGIDILVDYLVSARVPSNSLADNQLPLLADLLADKIIRPAGPAPRDGIDVDAWNRTIDATGGINPRLWAIGPIVEGATFYNHYVSTTDPDCRAISEAERAVSCCLGTLGLGG